MDTIDNQEMNIQETETLLSQNGEQNKAHLKSISNWLVLFSVCSLISCINYIGAGIFLMIDRSFFNPTRIFISVLLKHNILYGLVIIALGIIFLIPTYQLFKTCRMLKSYLKSGMESQYTLALKEFKSFCRFCGVATIIMVLGSVIYYFIG
ncbi:MAG: hypothetical protein IJJ77_00365 [Paludibacteraceae bacterium]|nr:hypothetical protein [Paludibacteraceae bacterium]